MRQFVMAVLAAIALIACGSTETISVSGSVSYHGISQAAAEVVVFKGEVAEANIHQIIVTGGGGEFVSVLDEPGDYWFVASKNVDGHFAWAEEPLYKKVVVGANQIELTLSSNALKSDTGVNNFIFGAKWICSRSYPAYWQQVQYGYDRAGCDWRTPTPCWVPLINQSGPYICSAFGL